MDFYHFSCSQTYLNAHTKFQTPTTIPSWKFSFGTDRHTDRQTHRSTYRGGAHLKINILAEEVNDIKAEEKRTFHKLKSLQDQVFLKTASQGTMLNSTKGEQSKQYEDTCLVNCRNNTESSKRLIDQHSNMPQDNGSIDQSCPLGFDDLVCYFETGSSCGLTLWETSLVQGGRQRARQEGQEHTSKLYTGQLLYLKIQNVKEIHFRKLESWR